MNISILKSALSMVGIDLNSLAEQAAPTIIEQLDIALKDIKLADGETKGIVIIPDNKGSYWVVKTVFDNEAHDHMIPKEHGKVDTLVKSIINSILH